MNTQYVVSKEFDEKVFLGGLRLFVKPKDYTLENMRNIQEELRNPGLDGASVRVCRLWDAGIREVTINGILCDILDSPE